MRLYKLPVKIDIKVYEKVTKKLVEILKTFTGVKAVYQLGEVSNPGISDLDILIILQNGFTLPSFNTLVKWFSKEERYVLMHSPFVLYENQINEVKNYFLLTNLKLLFGKEYNFSPQSDKTLRKKLAIVNRIGDLVTLFRFKYLNYYKVRPLLCSAKAAQYDFKIWDYSSGDNFINFVKDTRDNFFNLSQREIKQRILKIVEENVRVDKDFLTWVNSKIDPLFSLKYLDAYIREGRTLIKKITDDSELSIHAKTNFKGFFFKLFSNFHFKFNNKAIKELYISLYLPGNLFESVIEFKYEMDIFNVLKGNMKLNPGYGTLIPRFFTL